MADRSIVVRLQAVITDFQNKFKQAGAAATELAGKVDKVSPSLDAVGASATKAGLVIAAGLGFAAKAAIDWESAWAGVTKTVDGSASQLATLEGQLRDMATSMPATHQEIAAVAEAAGQLGVKTQDIAAFTKVMIDLGETTNLTADEAATSLAQFMNVMGTSASEVSNLGSAIVDLGNKGASTERDIVQMSQRIAAAGKSVGMSEIDVLGFASALASVGIEAEAGGTAISTSFKKIDAAVRQGSTSLDLIAKTAGMSSAEFKRAWGEDAAGATQAFVEGLGKVQQAGGDANGILTDLGMTGMRESDSLMRLAQAGSLLGDNLRNSASAWEENSALAEEAGKRYATTESQIKIAWNNIKDAAITAGGEMLPIISDIADQVAGLAKWFGDLPGPVQEATVKFAGLAAGTLLAVGGVSKMVTTGLELHGAMKDLAAIAPKAAGAITNVGKAAGIAAGLLLAAGAAVAAFGEEQNVKGADDLAASMLKAKDAAADLNSAFQFSSGAVIKNTFDGVGESLKRALDPTPMQSFEDAMNRAIPGTTALADTMAAQFGEVDKALGTLASGGKGELAAQQFKSIADAATAQSIPVEKLISLFPAYKSELESTAASLGVVGLSAQDYADWMGGKVPAAVAAAAEASRSADPAIQNLAGSMDDAATSAAATREQMMGLASAMLQLSGSEMGLEAAIDAATEALRENGQTAIDHGAALDIDSEAGRANKKALDSIASAALMLNDAQVAAGASTAEMDASTLRARESFIATAEAMGMSSAAANELANQYGLIPREVVTAISTPGATVSEAEAAALNAQLAAIPAEKRADIITIANTQGAKAAQDAINAVNSKTVTVTVNAVWTGTADAFRLLRGGSSGAMFDKAGAGLIRSYASGGFNQPRYAGSIGSRSPGIYPYAGMAGVLMNEEGSGPWEGIVSGHPAKRYRSRAITQEIARRLGGDVVWHRMADGGILGDSGGSRGGSRIVDKAALREAVESGTRSALAGSKLRLTGVGAMRDEMWAELDLTAARMGA